MKTFIDKTLYLVYFESIFLTFLVWTSFYITVIQTIVTYDSHFKQSLNLSISCFKAILFTKHRNIIKHWLTHPNTSSLNLMSDSHHIYAIPALETKGRPSEGLAWLIQKTYKCQVEYINNHISQVHIFLNNSVLNLIGVYLLYNNSDPNTSDKQNQLYGIIENLLT